MKQETNKPLYKVLNEKRTEGEWNVTSGKHTETTDYHDNGEEWFNVNGEGGTIADFLHGRCLSADEEEAKANAQYTALAVNNLHHLAEALQDLHAACMMDSDIPVSWWRKHRETVAKAKEALNKIS